MVLSLELLDTFSLQVLSKQISYMDIVKNVVRNADISRSFYFVKY